MDSQIILFYKYVHLGDPETVKLWQMELCGRLGLTGRCIVAPEGINATFEGTKANIRQYIKELEKNTKFKGIHFKLSTGTDNAFPKLSIKVRHEIVTSGLCNCDTCPVTDRELNRIGDSIQAGDFICNGIDPNEITGIHLKPAELHKWINEKREFYIIDMRNTYEHKVGHFEGSILPPIENFRDLPKVVEQIAHLKNKTVLTVCTGGVRCEKASGFLITQGFTDVYQLDGGIVSYMEKYPNEDFQGKLYVFDGRVTMGFYTDDSKHKVIGKCDACGEKSENYVNCANPVCHRHFICCEKCVKNGDKPAHNASSIADAGGAFCIGGCVLSRHGRKISPVEADLV